MLAADERLGVDLVHVLGARRPGGEPAVRRRDLEPADRSAVAGRWTGAGNEDSRAALHGVQPQRFGGGLQLNVHFHTLLLDGVFADGDDGSLEFHAAEPPSDEEVARLLATIYRRVQRLLARRGPDVDDTPDVDPLAEESPALAGISSASIQGRIALGPRAGARVYQLGREPDAPWVTSRGPCQAHLEGFDLHASITVGADDRAGVERLCRYVLRPPVAQERLALTPDGLVLVTLKSEWHDGTSHLLFTPVELLEKLAALTPRPRINLVLYHGILAPRARARAHAVAQGAAAPSPGERLPTAAEEPGPDPSPPAADVSGTAPAEKPGDAKEANPPEKPRDWKWADLMRRVFDLDVLACPRGAAAACPSSPRSRRPTCCAKSWATSAFRPTRPRLCRPAPLPRCPTSSPTPRPDPPPPP